MSSIVWTSKNASVLALPEGAWIVLGFLLDGAGPRSGYDLQAQAARSVAHFWPITKAHVYSALPRLESAGLVTSEHVEQIGVPDKRIFKPTPLGRSAFTQWLMDTDLGAAKLRHPLLVKIFFGSMLAPAALHDLLDRHEKQCRQGIAQFKSLIDAAKIAGSVEEKKFRLLTIRHGVASLEAELKWIISARKIIAN